MTTNKCQHCDKELENKRAKNCPACSALLTSANKRGTYGFVMEAAGQAWRDGLRGEAVREVMTLADKFGQAKRNEWMNEYRAAQKARVGELENSRLDEALALLKRVAALDEPMSCGHPGRFVIKDTNGKQDVCVICLGSQQAEEMDRYWKAVGLLSPDISIDDAIEAWKAREAELAGAMDGKLHADGQMIYLAEKLKKADAKIEILRKALITYADPDNWTEAIYGDEEWAESFWLPQGSGFALAEAALYKVDKMDKE